MPSIHRSAKARAHLIVAYTIGALALGLNLHCSGPQREGPQIPKVPEGFMFDANASKARNILADEWQLRQEAWVTMGDEEHSSIYFTTYRGAVSREEVAAAHDAQASRYGYLEYGPLEDLTIDGRAAWGWLETQVYRGKLASLEYKAVVAYDSLSYAVEFHSSEPRFLDPAALKALVETFRVR